LSVLVVPYRTRDLRGPLVNKPLQDVIGCFRREEWCRSRDCDLTFKLLNLKIKIFTKP
jgi:hypothetical protein